MRARYPSIMTFAPNSSDQPNNQRTDQHDDRPGPESEMAPVSPPPAPAGIGAVEGNRAALTMLLTQLIASYVAVRYLQLSQGLATIFAFVVTLAVLFLAFRRTSQALLADTRWRTLPHLGIALGAFGLAFLASRAFSLAYLALFGGLGGRQPTFNSSGTDQMLLMLGAGLLIPLGEEIAFRGLLMRGHERAAGFTVAALTATLAFALAHGVPMAVVGILPLAYILARVVQYTGSLWNSVIVHALNNTLALVAASFLLKADPKNADEAMQTLQNEALRVPVGLGALFFGAATLFVAHLWLKPKPDTQVLAAGKKPWLSGTYLAIFLLGLLRVWQTLPSAPDWLKALG